MLRLLRLIETRVVFELFGITGKNLTENRLIETRVVFEYGDKLYKVLCHLGLIETRVVFELPSENFI